MEVNKFELTGRITYIDIKFSNTTGKAVTRALMSKKSRKEGEYDTYAITFFGDTAEKFGETIKKGDTVNVSGRIGVNKYEKDGKTVEKLELYGNEFALARYDEVLRDYVPA